MPASRSAEFIPHPGSRTSVRPLERFDGPFNMAEDARLLADAEEGRPGWRVYGWDGVWVSLGMHQDPLRDLLRPDETNWVMRPTGGKAVLHGHDVTVGLALPLSLLSKVSGEPEERLARSLKAVYRLAIAPIVEALIACGLPAVLAERKAPSPFPDKSGKGEGVGGEGSSIQNPKSKIQNRVADCFAATSPNDVVHAKLGIKVCGCALRLTQKAVLVQASIPAGPPLVDPKLIFERPSQVPFVPWESERFEEAFEEALRRFAQ